MIIFKLLYATGVIYCPKQNLGEPMPGHQYTMQRTMPFSQGRKIKMAPVRGKGFQMPPVRGGSAKPTPQQQAVVDVHLPPKEKEDTSYMHTSYATDFAPEADIAMTEMDMLAPVEAPVEVPKKGISPITYAVGAAVLLLGGLYLLKN
jgi:hypothetical protein